MSREVRWIALPGEDVPRPAWEQAPGQWVVAGLPRLAPPGSRTHAAILGAAPVPEPDADPDLELRGRIVAAVRAAWPSYAREHGRESLVPPVRPDGNTAALIDLSVDLALRMAGVVAAPADPTAPEIESVPLFDLPAEQSS